MLLKSPSGEWISGLRRVVFLLGFFVLLVFAFGVTVPLIAVARLREWAHGVDKTATLQRAQRPGERLASPTSPTHQGLVGQGDRTSRLAPALRLANDQEQDPQLRVPENRHQVVEQLVGHLGPGDRS